MVLLFILLHLKPDDVPVCAMGTARRHPTPRPTPRRRDDRNDSAGDDTLHEVLRGTFWVVIAGIIAVFIYKAGNAATRSWRERALSNTMNHPYNNESVTTNGPWTTTTTTQAYHREMQGLPETWHTPPP